jgi:hypothetical protein
MCKPLNDWMSVVAPGYHVMIFGAPRLPLFNNMGLHIFGKEPDISIGLGHRFDADIMKEIIGWGFPPIVIEVGYSETYKQLVDDARDWLLFSNQKILSVIIFKWTKPVEEQDSLDPLKWELFAEVYERYAPIHFSLRHYTNTQIRDGNKIIRYGDRIQVLPPSDIPPTLKLLP